MWFRGLARVRVYRRLVLRERRLDEPLPDRPLPDGLEVRRLTPREAPAYSMLRPDQARGEYERRLEAGHWCFATWREDAIISVTWTARMRCRIDYLEQDILLDDDEVYNYDQFTAAAARGQGITVAGRVPHLRFLRDQGYRRALATHGPDNRAARALQTAIGFRPVGWIGYVGVGPWRRHFCCVQRGVKPLVAG
jgi:hypothetical protein